MIDFLTKWWIVSMYAHFTVWSFWCCEKQSPKDFQCLSFYDFAKGSFDKYNIIPLTLSRKVEIVMQSEVLALVMTACWLLFSSSTYFWRNVNISSIFYLKSTSINIIQWPIGHSGHDAVYERSHKTKTHWQDQLKPLDTWYWFTLQFSIELDAILVQCHFNIDGLLKTINKVNTTF